VDSELGDDLAFFFARPTVPFERHAQRDQQSVLYLVRREAQDCLIGKVVPESQVLRQFDQHRLFATVMVVFAGIDLVAKFAADNDADREVRYRFVGFAGDYLSLTDGVPARCGRCATRSYTLSA
jgi:hypothetical protein